MDDRDQLRDHETRCDHCDAAVEASYRFCPDCGADLHADERPGEDAETDSNHDWYVDLTDAPLAPLDYQFPDEVYDFDFSDEELRDQTARNADTIRFEPIHEALATPVPHADDSSGDEPGATPRQQIRYPGRLFAHAPADPATRLAAEPTQRSRQLLLARRIAAAVLAAISLILLIAAIRLTARAFTKFPDLAQPAQHARI